MQYLPGLNSAVICGRLLLLFIFKSDPLWSLWYIALWKKDYVPPLVCFEKWNSAPTPIYPYT